MTSITGETTFAVRGMVLVAHKLFKRTHFFMKNLKSILSNKKIFKTFKVAKHFMFSTIPLTSSCKTNDKIIPIKRRPIYRTLFSLSCKTFSHKLSN